MFDVLPDDPSTRPLADVLPRLDPEQAAARNRLLAVLDRLQFKDAGDTLRLQVRLADARPAGPGIAFRAGSGPVQLFPHVVAGATADPDADDAALLATLDRLEPLIAALERATAEDFEPVAVTHEAQDGLVVRIAARADPDRIVHEVTVAFAPGAPARWPDPKPDVADAAAQLGVQIPARVYVEVGHVRAQAVGRLRVGDMILAPLGPDGAWTVELTAAGLGRRARLDPSSYIFSVPETETALAQPDNAPVSDDPAPDAGEGPALADLRVPVQIMLGETAMTLAELSALRPGSTVVLEGLDLTSPATLLASGSPVGRGRLVAVGQAYGLILDTVGGKA